MLIRRNCSFVNNIALEFALSIAGWILHSDSVRFILRHDVAPEVALLVAERASYSEVVLAGVVSEIEMHRTDVSRRTFERRVAWTERPAVLVSGLLLEDAFSVRTSVATSDRWVTDPVICAHLVSAAGRLS